MSPHPAGRDLQDALRGWARARGCEVAFGTAAALDDALGDLERRRKEGELEPEFDREQLAGFARPAAPPSSIFLVAVPRPAHRVLFELAGGPAFETLLPPTYVHYRRFPESLLEELAAELPALRGRIAPLDAPLKALASRVGLVEYGRNNVTFLPGRGSYFQLAGFATDADLGLDPAWRPQPPRLLAACEGCRGCRTICPTDAIDDDRTLLHAERCVTLATERAGDLRAPLPVGRYRCLLGCLECQRACPVNKNRLRIEEGATFAPEETAALLAGREGDPAVRASIRARLDALGLTQEALIGRNLGALLARAGRR